jgi:hypothetical protein
MKIMRNHKIMYGGKRAYRISFHLNSYTHSTCPILTFMRTVDDIYVVSIWKNDRCNDFESKSYRAARNVLNSVIQKTDDFYVNFPNNIITNSF